MYDKQPFIPVSSSSELCFTGWESIARELKAAISDRRRPIVCMETYPGVFVDQIVDELAPMLHPALVLQSKDCLRGPAEIQSMLDPWLTDDPVFGMICDLDLAAFFESEKLRKTRSRIDQVRHGLVLAIGPGISLITDSWDVLVYADMARWEIQRRQRCNEVANLGVDNLDELPSLKYKRSFFVDWRICDRLKQRLLPVTDYLLDTNTSDSPKMITGEIFRGALNAAAQRPFRVVPFFDPGPWGGHWMGTKFNLPPDAPNYAWCFDCVPEENSLLLGFGDLRVEIPAIDLVFSHPQELLGENIHRNFGAEFPIRFDFLDTVGGGNLSLQVHPLNEYIRAHFGVQYTQDESYYLLDADEGACVYLGLKEGIDPQRMIRDLQNAQMGSTGFDPELYVNRFQAQKHDHFLIPAGTVHCSGAGSMVLEISATPYIFTFKLWDWGRPGLDGRPRPIHLEHGVANIQWNRTTPWVEKSLVNRTQLIGRGDGWTEERTGLHSLQFIETRRHWFNKAVPHHTAETVNVLNLVEGEEAIVESPSSSFEPFAVHYAETFIVPAQIGAYTIRPAGPSAGKRCATIKAFVREINGVE